MVAVAGGVDLFEDGTASAEDALGVLAGVVKDHFLGLHTARFAGQEVDQLGAIGLLDDLVSTEVIGKKGPLEAQLGAVFESGATDLDLQPAVMFFLRAGAAVGFVGTFHIHLEGHPGASEALADEQEEDEGSEPCFHAWVSWGSGCEWISSGARALAGRPMSQR